MATDVMTVRVRAGGDGLRLPQEMMDRYHLREGDEVELVAEDRCLRIRKPSRRDLSQFVGILKDTALAPTTDEYMREIRPR
jgi:antitoxin component of MazEF toxin-antitoxin module